MDSPVAYRVAHLVADCTAAKKGCFPMALLFVGCGTCMSKNFAKLDQVLTREMTTIINQLLHLRHVFLQLNKTIVAQDLMIAGAGKLLL
jgi:hypothetical protein